MEAEYNVYIYVCVLADYKLGGRTGSGIRPEDKGKGIL